MTDYRKDPRVDTIIDDLGYLNGFPKAGDYQIALSSFTITFNDATRTITVSPTGDFYYIYWQGRRLLITEPMSVQIINLEGPHAIMYDGLNNELRSFPFIAIPAPVRRNSAAFFKHDVYVCVTYWNSTDLRFEYVGNQALPNGTNYINTNYVNYGLGTVYMEGMGLDNFTIGDGSLNAHAQFSIYPGYSNLYGTVLTHDAVLATEEIPVYYQTGNFLGAGIGLFRKGTQAGFKVLNAPGGRLYWNKYDAGTMTWSLQVATNNYHVLYHIFSSGSVSGKKYFAIMGWGEYLVVADAREAALREISELNPSLIDLDNFARVGTIIFKTSDTYTNSVKAKIVLTESGEAWQDFRGVYA